MKTEQDNYRRKDSRRRAWTANRKGRELLFPAFCFVAFRFCLGQRPGWQLDNFENRACRVCNSGKAAIR